MTHSQFEDCEFSFTDGAMLEIFVGNPVTMIVVMFAVFSVLARLRVHIGVLVRTRRGTIGAVASEKFAANGAEFILGNDR